MSGTTGRLDPAVARVRRAVRLALADLPPGQRLLVAASGGADSTALAAATVFEGRHAGWQVGAVVVDHGLQPDSITVASEVAQRLCELGCEPVEVSTIDVAAGAGGQGPEAAARSARYEALGEAAERHQALMLLGHTRDDQAESVLLGLARGSGTRSLAGMPPERGPYRRPLLGVPRADTRRACEVLRLSVWDDPHNGDPRFARARVRSTVLPVLEAELGPGVAEALARTAEQARLDADALDALADALLDSARDEAGGLAVPVLVGGLAAVRRRCLRRAALVAGCPGGELVAVHVDALDSFVTHWHGQAAIRLPAGLLASRLGDRIVFEAAAARASGRRESRDRAVRR